MKFTLLLPPAAREALCKMIKWLAHQEGILSSPRSRVILRFPRCSNLYLCILCKFSSACVDRECGQNQSFANQISCLLETTCTVCMVCPIFSYSAMYNKLCSMSRNVEVRDTVSTRLALFVDCVGNLEDLWRLNHYYGVACCMMNTFLGIVQYKKPICVWEVAVTAVHQT